MLNRIERHKLVIVLAGRILVWRQKSYWNTLNRTHTGGVNVQIAFLFCFLPR